MLGAEINAVLRPPPNWACLPTASCHLHEHRSPSSSQGCARRIASCGWSGRF